MATIPIPNSSTSGYLVPAAPPPAYGEALEDIFHDFLLGLLGWTDGTLLRPRWQPEPPDQPEAETDWLAFGINVTSQDFDPFQLHNPDYYGPDGGATITQLDEEFEIHISYYGPNAALYQSQVERGIKVAQNRASLDALKIKFAGAQKSYRLPALLKQKYVNRIDQKMSFRRRIESIYAILNIASAEVRSLNNEQYLTDITINPPPSP